MYQNVKKKYTFLYLSHTSVKWVFLKQQRTLLLKIFFKTLSVLLTNAIRERKEVKV